MWLYGIYIALDGYVKGPMHIHICGVCIYIYIYTGVYICIITADMYLYILSYRYTHGYMDVDLIILWM